MSRNALHLDPPDDSTLAAIEEHAVRMARRAGQTLMGYFGSPLDVDFKDEAESDPVTNVDREVQGDMVRAPQLSCAPTRIVDGQLTRIPPARDGVPVGVGQLAYVDGAAHRGPSATVGCHA